MPNVESMIKARRVLCIKKFLDTNPAGWKCFFELYLKKVGGKFIFHEVTISPSRLLQRIRFNLVFLNECNPSDK